MNENDYNQFTDEYVLKMSNALLGRFLESCYKVEHTKEMFLLDLQTQEPYKNYVKEELEYFIHTINLLYQEFSNNKNDLINKYRGKIEEHCNTTDYNVFCLIKYILLHSYAILVPPYNQEVVDKNHDEFHEKIIKQFLQFKHKFDALGLMNI